MFVVKYRHTVNVYSTLERAEKAICEFVVKNNYHNIDSDPQITNLFYKQNYTGFIFLFNNWVHQHLKLDLIVSRDLQITFYEVQEIDGEFKILVPGWSYEKR